MSRLQRLLLQSNQLTELPMGIGSLAHLTECDLRHNRLGALPASFARLQQLQRTCAPSPSLAGGMGRADAALPWTRVGHDVSDLRLSGNLLHRLPEGFKKLVKLETLLLDNNRLVRVALPPLLVAGAGGPPAWLTCAREMVHRWVCRLALPSGSRICVR